MATLLPLVGIALLFWLFILRPQSRRQKELRSMQSSLSVNDEVMLTSGVYGTIREATDDHVLVEIAEGVVIKVAPGAIGTKIHQYTDEDEGDDQRVDSDSENNTPGASADGPEEI